MDKETVAGIVLGIGLGMTIWSLPFITGFGIWLIVVAITIYIDAKLSQKAPSP